MGLLERLGFRKGLATVSPPQPPRDLWAEIEKRKFCNREPRNSNITPADRSELLFKNAKLTLNFFQLIAATPPFTPFITEAEYQKKVRMATTLFLIQSQAELRGRQLPRSHLQSSELFGSMFDTLLDEVSKELDLPTLPYQFKQDDPRRNGLRMIFTSDVPVLHAHTERDIGFLTDTIRDFRERYDEPYDREGWRELWVLIRALKQRLLTRDTWENRAQELFQGHSINKTTM